MSVVDGLPFNDKKKDYILKTLDPVLEELVGDVLAGFPNGYVLDHMIQFLRKRSGLEANSSSSLVQKNETLQRQLKQATASLGEVSAAIGSDPKKDDPEEEEEEDDECDEIPESMMKSADQQGRARQSVSAEAYGAFNVKKEFTPPSYPKTDEQKGRVSSTLKKSFMFSDVDPKDMDTLLMAMKEMSFDAGTKVINEGENGDYLFVIEKGELECTKIIDNAAKVVKTCAPGDVFGELALLYNCPRAASVSAKDACVCWQLDRETFNHVVKDAASKQRERYDGFLKGVALISGLSAYERSQVAEALKPETFKKNDVVVKQDDPGDKFYIIEEGNLYAMKSVAGGEDKRVMEYKPGDFFGELALLKNQPRAASVVVASDDCKVLSMSRVAFSKMLGPLQDLLQRQVQSYA